MSVKRVNVQTREHLKKLKNDRKTLNRLIEILIKKGIIKQEDLNEK